MSKKATEAKQTSSVGQGEALEVRRPSAVRVTLLARDRASELRWLTELTEASRGIPDFVVSLGTDPREPSEIVLVDHALRGLEATLDSLDRQGRMVFLLVDEAERAPLALAQGKVDDVLVQPIRVLEFQSKLRQRQQFGLWEEVNKMNASFAETLDLFRGDLELARRIQKSKLPQRFNDLKGFQVANRYLAGMRSGGDHFDVAEAKDGAWTSFVLTDSSSYGLSSSMLTVLMKVTLKLTADEVRSSAETVSRIQDELKLTLGPKDRLSLFYATLSRKDYRLRYVNFGSSVAFHASSKGKFQLLGACGGTITLAEPAVPVESELALAPGDRLALISDGFVEGLGGVEKVQAVLDAHRNEAPADTLNELVYQLKKGILPDNDGMPAQDSTAVLFDVDPKLLRLARS